MSRLTKENYTNDVLNYKGTQASYNDLTWNKLNKLEVIEEELGCPLEVIINASRNGFYYLNTFNEIKYIPYCFVNYKDCTFRDVVWFICRFKDYGKTWWLKEDKSE